MQQVADRVFVKDDYDGVNIGAILTDQGFICIDAPSFPRDARNWIARLRQVSHRPIRYLILTDCHGDRVMNARWFNAPVIMHVNAAQSLSKYDRRYPQSFFDRLQAQNPVSARELSSGPVVRPTLTFDRQMSLRLGDRTVELLHAPGPSLGSIWVKLSVDAGNDQTRQILFTGDTIVSDTHPRLENVCSSEWLGTIGRLRSVARDVSLLVPGRGCMGDARMLEPVSAYLRSARAFAASIATDGEPNGGRTMYVRKLVEMFPCNGFPRKFIEEEVHVGLEHLYNEIKLLSNGKHNG